MSDIRKIQTGNNQYTLHARVTDKLASVAKYISASQNNYPWHRIATSGVLTTKVIDDKSVFLFLAEHYNDGRQGIIQISLRRNNTANSSAVAKWISRSGFNIDDVQLGLNSTPGDTCLDIFVRTSSPWTGGNVMMLSRGSRGVDVDYYEFVNSSEATNTTTTDKKNSVEVYKTIEEAATQLHDKAYTSIIKPTDVGTVANAGYAEKIGTNKSHPQIGSSTKPVYVDEYGRIQACSRNIPIGITVDSTLNGTSTNAIQNMAVVEALKAKADTSALNNYLTKNDAGNTYAKKDDISKVYKYQGSVNKVSDLPNTLNLTASNAGDVYNVGTASTNGSLTVKSGDNVAWVWDKTKNTGHWDNLSGTVDLSNYLQKGGKQTTTSTADGGSNVYTFADGSTITVKNGSKGSTGPQGPQGVQGLKGETGATGAVGPKGTDGTPCTHSWNGSKLTVTSASGTSSADLKGPQGPAGPQGPQGHAGTSAIWFSGTAVVGNGQVAVAGSKAGDMYLNSKTFNVYKATAANTWSLACNIKGAQGVQGNPGQNGTNGTSATWFSGGAVTGTSTTAKTFPVSGSKAGDMYLNTGTSNVYKATAANQWVYLCNIKGPQGTPGNNGTTPTIKAAAGGSINSVGTPTVSATTNGTTTTFTFNNLKGQKGDKGATGATVIWHTGTVVTGAGTYPYQNEKVGDMYLNTDTSNVYKATAATAGGMTEWALVCNIKGAKGDAANIPKLAKGVAGIVPGTINDNLSASRWLNGGDNGTGAWRALPTAGGGTSGMVRTCKDYTGSIDPTKISGYAHGTTPPTLQPITTGASDYRGVESDGSGRLFVNVPAYEKNINRAQNTVLAAPTTGTGTATFRKLTTSDIPWNEKFKVMTPAQYKTATKLTNVFYFILEE